jgi:hypothetical protein
MTSLEDIELMYERFKERQAEYLEDSNSKMYDYLQTMIDWCVKNGAVKDV